MKRITLFAAMMLFLAGAGFTQTASTATAKKQTTATPTVNTPAACKFVDNNKDGICDNCQGKMKNGKGADFVDKNGDGICDHHQGTGAPKDCPKAKGADCKNHNGNGNCCGTGAGKACGKDHKCGPGK